MQIGSAGLSRHNRLMTGQTSREDTTYWNGRLYLLPKDGRRWLFAERNPLPYGRGSLGNLAKQDGSDLLGDKDFENIARLNVFVIG